MIKETVSMKMRKGKALNDLVKEVVQKRKKVTRVRKTNKPGKTRKRVRKSKKVKNARTSKKANWTRL
jgi:hypothetical protein